eukprot:1160808-Pelagomonas_calceolata.AAC.15
MLDVTVVTSYFFRLCRRRASSASLFFSALAAAASASAVIWAAAAAACGQQRHCFADEIGVIWLRGLQRKVLQKERQADTLLTPSVCVHKTASRSWSAKGRRTIAFWRSQDLRSSLPKSQENQNQPAHGRKHHKLACV